MDLMIDCMPYNGFDDKLYEMLEDDMRTFSNINCPTTSSSSGSSSPSCLSDEEQLAALSNCPHLIDEFVIFTSPTTATAANSNNYSQSTTISNQQQHHQQQQQLHYQTNNNNNNNHHHHHQQSQLQLQQHPIHQQQFQMHRDKTNQLDNSGLNLASSENLNEFNNNNNNNNNNSASNLDNPFNPIYTITTSISSVGMSDQTCHLSSPNNSSSSSSSSCSSSPSISTSSSLAPSPLSLSSSSSSLCAALANASFNSSNSSSSSSACSSNLSSPSSLSPNQFSNSSHIDGINYQLYSSTSMLLKQKLTDDDLTPTIIPKNKYSNETNNFAQISATNGCNNNNNNIFNLNLDNKPVAAAINVKNIKNHLSSCHNSNESSAAAQVNNGNNNYTLYQAINPLDINRNYTTKQLSNSYYDSREQQSQCEEKTINPNDDQSHMNIIQKAPFQQQNKSNFNNATFCNVVNNQNQNQQIKRGKYNHNNNQLLNLNDVIIKQENHFTSDGESIISNESDSNSSTLSNNNNNNLFTTNSNNNEVNAGNAMPPFQSTTKKVIITTKLEQIYCNNKAASNTTVINKTASGNSMNAQLANVNSCGSQINIIKIASPTTTTTTGGGPLKTTTLKSANKDNVDSLLNSVTTTNSSQPAKTIIQYKHLYNGNNGTTTNTNTTTGNVIKPKNNRQNNTQANSNSNCGSGSVHTPQVTLRSDGKAYPKPPYSYSCLIAMSLRNSDSGTLPVSDIYEFIVENFPYYKTARDGWKNSIRHNLSLNKCFEKIENPTNGSKKGCLWALNPDKCKKLEEECKRCRQRDPVNIRLSMSRPDDLNKIERGEQRIKKYTSQRKLLENNSTTTAANSASNTSQSAMENSSQIININNPTKNDKYLIEWTSKDNNSVVIKEENIQFYDDVDIKFDPNLLSAQM